MDYQILFLDNLCCIFTVDKCYISKSTALSSLDIFAYVGITNSAVSWKDLLQVFAGQVWGKTSNKHLLSQMIQLALQCWLWVNFFSIQDMLLHVENLCSNWLFFKSYVSKALAKKWIFQFSKSAKILSEGFWMLMQLNLPTVVVGLRPPMNSLFFSWIGFIFVVNAASKEMRNFHFFYKHFWWVWQVVLKG